MTKPSNEAREAAANVLESLGLTATAACVRDGDGDSDPTVREIMKFEAVLIERAASIADGNVMSGNDRWCAGYDTAARKIARSIRELKA